MSFKALQKISMEVQKIATAPQLAICPHDEKEVSPVWPASFYFCKKSKREMDNKKCQHPLWNSKMAADYIDLYKVL